MPDPVSSTSNSYSADGSSATPSTASPAASDRRCAATRRRSGESMHFSWTCVSLGCSRYSRSTGR
jgi:hypothetical protein